MKTNGKQQPGSDLSHSEPLSPVAAATTISEAARTLLVVDDDPAVRNLKTEVLRRQGYAVLQAESAREAMRIAASRASIDLLITDLAMPEVDGLELTRRFRTVHPKTPVLMVSGSLPLLRDGNEDLDRLELLAKPFAFDEFVGKVRRLVDAIVPPPRRPASRVD